MCKSVKKVYQVYNYLSDIVPSRGVKIKIQIWNTFKRRTKVLKINLTADTDTGSPVSF